MRSCAIVLFAVVVTFTAAAAVEVCSDRKGNIVELLVLTVCNKGSLRSGEWCSHSCHIAVVHECRSISVRVRAP